MASSGPATGKGAARRAAEQRAEAARARVAAAQRRRRLITVGSAVAAVMAVIAALVIVKVVTGAGGPKSGQRASTAGSAVLRQVSSVPASVLDAIGAGSATTPPKPITGPALTTSGKPEVFYAGAEYCPYCATERWSVVIALSRFGSFHNLGQTASSPSDVYPSTATLSFHGAGYTSSYLAFTGKELQSNQVVNGAYATLDTLTPAEEALVKKYDAPPLTSQAGAIPFIDIGGKYAVSGAEYDPQVLHGKTHAQIAAALSDPSSPIAKGADGAANLITAALCRLTGNRPLAVCTSTGVTTAGAVLAHG